MRCALRGSGARSATSLGWRFATAVSQFFISAVFLLVFPSSRSSDHHGAGACSRRTTHVPVRLPQCPTTVNSGVSGSSAFAVVWASEHARACTCAHAAAVLKWPRFPLIKRTCWIFFFFTSLVMVTEREFPALLVVWAKASEETPPSLEEVFFFSRVSAAIVRGWFVFSRLLGGCFVLLGGVISRCWARRFRAPGFFPVARACKNARAGDGGVNF